MTMCRSIPSLSRVHSIALSKFPKLFSKFHSLSRESMNPGSTCCDHKPGWMLHGIVPGEQPVNSYESNRLQFLTIDVEYRVLLEIMRFVYKGIVEIETYGDESLAFATSLLAAADRFDIDPLCERCLSWLRLHADPEVFYILDFSISARCIQRTSNYDAVIALICDVFNEFIDLIIHDADYSSVSFDTLKSILPRLSTPNRHLMHEIVYRWNAFDEHPIHEALQLMSLVDSVQFTTTSREFVCELVSPGTQIFRVIINSPREPWNVEVGFDHPSHMFTIANTEHPCLSLVRHPGSFEESYITSVLGDTVEFSVKISSCVGDRCFLDIFIASTVVSSIDIPFEFGLMTFRVVSKSNATITVFKI